jgi:nitrous oxidase accessory protein NosD
LLVLGLTLFAAVAPAKARTIKVNAGDDLQAAIDRARGGDTIAVRAGATFTGPFTLPAHPGRRAITIRSSRLAKLPRGRRVRARDARHMPRLLTPGRGLPVLATALRAKAGASPACTWR